MRVAAIINQKGGVGKTTSTVNLGAALGRMGHRVLLIDIDPQANTSFHLNVDVYREMESVYDVLMDRKRICDLVRKTPEENVDILPSNLDLAAAELELASTVGREVILREALEKESREGALEYDVVLIDCAPSLGLLAVNALSAARDVLIPIQAQYFALQGMSKLIDVVRLVRERINRQLEISGILVCMYQSNTNLGREVVDEVKRYFGDKVFETMVRQNIKLAEAPSHGQSIFKYDPGSRGAQDYKALALEVVKRWPELLSEEAREESSEAPSEEASTSSRNADDSHRSEGEASLG